MASSELTIFATYREWTYFFETDFYLTLRFMLGLFYINYLKDRMIHVFVRNTCRCFMGDISLKKKDGRFTGSIVICMITPVLQKQREISSSCTVKYICTVIYIRGCLIFVDSVGTHYIWNIILAIYKSWFSFIFLKKKNASTKLQLYEIVKKSGVPRKLTK